MILESWTRIIDEETRSINGPRDLFPASSVGSEFIIIYLLLHSSKPTFRQALLCMVGVITGAIVWELEIGYSGGGRRSK